MRFVSCLIMHEDGSLVAFPVRDQLHDEEKNFHDKALLHKISRHHGWVYGPKAAKTGPCRMTYD